MTAPTTLLALVQHTAQALEQAQVHFGHGTTNAWDEAAWLVLHSLGLPLDTPLEGSESQANRPVTPVEYAAAATLLGARTSSRKPLAYLIKQAWLQGVPFYVDERSIVPRSLIAELLADGSLDYWLSESTQRVLDLCTGNGSLAVLTAMTYPDVVVDASDLSPEALEVARINVAQHQLQSRITLLQSDGLHALTGPYDLIVCNPPYVNADSMAALPAEYQAEPAMALSGNLQGGADGMDFIRPLLADVARVLSPIGVLVLEIGHERAYFENAFPELNPIWLETSAGSDQVLLLTRDALNT
ncbi:50S ribosomal protein L3 N(5)-glutamine methyltransferase [Curvibacter sp. CHRR-16]|uniref:50S ribosomal protein L3 N(5)-glutamine methyltransferase n=1 Tax=Curvibacter sp. CHRR-16 TaxID=2835872 RepID=UPI001BD990E9|nr:50S ribosomal protein L3 N(5)-glutamine methyltransferase [Curvibacter sp. CHRR-16]MBT0571791.1 50S ribosomal protein L3 N(5)-glutamine methyltransferase [Curvibacter sp. CHRR-16]